MSEPKIRIPSDVLEGLEAVRKSGKTNMLDMPVVMKLALDMGHPQTMLWVREHQPLYAVGIFRSFEPTDALDEVALRAMAQRFLDEARGGG